MQGALGVDQLLEFLAMQQPAVDDANGTDGYDFIAALGIETGRFRIEHREGQFGQQAIVKIGELQIALE